MATTAMEKLTEFLATDEGQKYFMDWLGHPVSQMLFPAARELCRPHAPRTPEESGIRLGECLGANNILDFVTNPYSKAADRIRGTLPPARYGVPSVENKKEKV